MAQAQEAIAGRARTGRSSADAGQDPSDGRGTSASANAPDFTEVNIDSNKITAYAMNPDHPVGGNKYRVINSITGLDVGDATRIDQQIRDGVRASTPIEGKADQYGQRRAVA